MTTANHIQSRHPQIEQTRNNGEPSQQWSAKPKLHSNMNEFEQFWKEDWANIPPQQRERLIDHQSHKHVLGSGLNLFFSSSEPDMFG